MGRGDGEREKIQTRDTAELGEVKQEYRGDSQSECVSCRAMTSWFSACEDGL